MFIPPDQDARDTIIHNTDISILVEAAAGTGKTTSMVGRLVEMIASGTAKCEHIAAVTFTRKATNELRTRFLSMLKKEASMRKGEEAENLKDALANSSKIFIGTIHSFAGRLLRERPVEAEIDLDFKSLEDDEDQQLRHEAWNKFVATLYAEGDPYIDELKELGLEISELNNAFANFAAYPDIDCWPMGYGTEIHIDTVQEEIDEYLGHLRSLLPTLPEDSGRDKLIPAIKRICRMAENADSLALLEHFNPAEPYIVQKIWPEGKPQALSERECWMDFNATTVQPYMRALFARRYECVMRGLLRAKDVYDQLRSLKEALNFQDLLTLSCKLLREHKHIRRHFARSFTHLLVDEFQDTDPLQAEMMMLLTSSDLDQADWKKCRPRAGSLFVVGDPKQSIYRFRRADIVTYNEVRRIITDSGGEVLELSANFRCARSVVQWVNGVFEGSFPDEPNVYAPRYVPLDAAQIEGESGTLSGVMRVEYAKEHSKNKPTLQTYEPNFIARLIRQALDGKFSVARSARELQNSEVTTEAVPGDFMIVTGGKKNVSLYSKALTELRIPNTVTGEGGLGDIAELRLLGEILTATSERDNAVALVAVLRGEGFGVSDAELWSFKNAGGEFRLGAKPITSHVFTEHPKIRNGFKRLMRYANLLSRLGAAAGCSKIIDEMGLVSRASLLGSSRNLCALTHLLTIMRTEAANTWSLIELIDKIKKITTGELPTTIPPVYAPEGGCVRIMNAHKVKGLEAPVVILADPTGYLEPWADFHIDRSGLETQGFLTIRRKDPHNPYNKRGIVVAAPFDWTERSDEEEKFLTEEKKRLYYVAATRASACLIVPRRETRNQDNYWKYFDSYINELPQLDDPGIPKTTEPKPRTLLHSEIDEAFTGIDTKWSALTQNSYITKPARMSGGVLGVCEHENNESGYAQEALFEINTQTWDANTEIDRVAWGNSLHNILEEYGANPEIDLKDITERVLAANNIDLTNRDMAMNFVDAAVNSKLWKRVLASKRYMLEVPVNHRTTTESGIECVIRGALDLVFQEDDGWVIVDYKTDRVSDGNFVAHARGYASQLLAYRELWTRAFASDDKDDSNNRVKEVGLLFLTGGVYVKTW